MEEHIFEHIKDDVAIEIIGKMIAEEMAKLYKVLDEFKQAGFDEMGEAATEATQHYRLKIREYKAEINQIYRGQNLKDIYDKVDCQYAPYLKKKYGFSYV